MNNLEIPKHNDCDINITGHINYYTTDESSGISRIKISGRHYSKEDEIEYFLNGKFNKDMIGTPVNITFKLVIDNY